MCRAVVCKACGRATWSGCGVHVEQVLAGVPEADRCPGHPREEREPGWLARLFSRG